MWLRPRSCHAKYGPSDASFINFKECQKSGFLLELFVIFKMLAINLKYKVGGKEEKFLSLIHADLKKHWNDVQNMQQY